tara:strand:+ start:364 stop:2157 length:1794 start_codon:yes stop_codon:yes gene_type:complete
MPKSLDDILIIQDRKTREYEEFRTQALLLAQTLTPEWTDFYPHDPGVVLAELFSGIADNLSYYIDRAIHEQYLSTCQLRQSVVDHAALVGYKLKLPSSSVVTIDVVTSGAVTLTGTDTVGSLPFRVIGEASGDTKSTHFELLNTVTISSATTTALSFIEGQTVLNEVLGSSSAVAGLGFQLGGVNLTTDSVGNVALRVEVDEGSGFISWNLVDNFLDSTSTSKHYTIDTDISGRVTVLFGDGVNGKIPASGVSNVRATYRVGGGKSSNNVGIGTIKVIATPNIHVSSIINTNKPSGGSDRETIDEARISAPAYFTTQNRAVTHADYEAIARSVSGVNKAKAVWYQGSPLKEAIYVATSGDNPVPSGTWNIDKQSGTGILGNVGKAIKAKACSAIRLYILPITPVTIKLNVDVHVLENYYKSDVFFRVVSDILSFIQNTDSTELPGLLPLSGLMKAIESTLGVDYVDVHQFHRVPYVESVSTGIANTTFVDGDTGTTNTVTTGNALKEEEWTIFFTSSTAFNVIGSVSGMQAATGTVGTNYISDNSEISFKAVAGTNTNKYGDTYKIVTSAYVGNITIFDTEIPVMPTSTVNTIGGIS